MTCFSLIKIVLITTLCRIRTVVFLKSPSFQTGEYATDEEEDEVGPILPGGDMAIEVFELPENEDMFSPSDLDTSKLSHKFKEVSTGLHNLCLPAPFIVQSVFICAMNQESSVF